MVTLCLWRRNYYIFSVVVVHSQQKEDEILYNKFLNYPSGFYIELGAMDGITYSNTKFFEETLGWKGILIEPTNQYHTLIRTRPNNFNFNYTVSEIEGDIDFLGSDALGGIVSSMHDDHKFGWGLNTLTPYKVKSKPFYEIIKDIDIKKVDLFSIDVEGGELGVLKTFDWNIPIYIVLIEMSGIDKLKDEECRRILKDQGFEMNMEIGVNEVWINNKYEK